MSTKHVFFRVGVGVGVCVCVSLKHEPIHDLQNDIRVDEFRVPHKLKVHDTRKKVSKKGTVNTQRYQTRTYVESSS